MQVWLRQCAEFDSQSVHDRRFVTWSAGGKGPKHAEIAVAPAVPAAPVASFAGAASCAGEGSAADPPSGISNKAAKKAAKKEGRKAAKMAKRAANAAAVEAAVKEAPPASASVAEPLDALDAALAARVDAWVVLKQKKEWCVLPLQSPHVTLRRAAY